MRVSGIEKPRLLSLKAIAVKTERKFILWEPTIKLGWRPQVEASVSTRKASEEGATLAKAKEQRAGVGKILCPDGLATPECGKFEGDRGGREFVPFSKEILGA